MLKESIINLNVNFMPDLGLQIEVGDLFKRGLSTQVPEDGGYLIPPQQTQKFNEFLSEYSIIRNLANIAQISTDHLEILSDDNVSECGWVAENEIRPNTEPPKLKQHKIYAHEMYAKPKVSQKLIDDAGIDLENWLMRKIAEKMAVLENMAFLYGDGVNKPSGLFHGDRLPTFNGNTLDTLLDAQNAIKTRYLKHCVFLMSPQVFANIKHMKDQDSGRFLWQPQLSETNPSTLLGYQVVVCEQLQPNAIIFGSFYDGYQIVDRMGLTIVRDPYSNKPFVEFYARKRVGGDIINKEALVIIQFG